MADGLRIEGIHKRFGATSVLEGVTLRAEPDRITALIGQNGAGKSTLFRILMGLVAADAGSASVGDRDVLGVPLHRKHALGLGYLPQEGGSFGDLTVRENLLAILELLRLGRAERRQRLDELLDRTGLAPIADRRFSVLSGGEQRRLEIAKVLATRPRVLLLDEPFSGLEPRMVSDLAEMLRALTNEGVTTLLTDHNVHMTLAFVDHVFVLAGGVIVCEGTPGEVVQHEDAQRLYLGAGFKLQP